MDEMIEQPATGGDGGGRRSRGEGRGAAARRASRTGGGAVTARMNGKKELRRVCIEGPVFDLQEAVGW